MVRQGSKSVRTPIKLAHIVFRSNNFHAMRDFYLNFLDATIAFEEPDAMVIIRYDDEHHRIGILAMPDLQQKVKQSNGLEHIAFTYPSLEALMASYKERKTLFGIKPFWSVNHGPSMSIYYKDPDGNIIESQSDTLGVEDADNFMMSKTYKTNPIGVDFDPEELLAMVERGDDVSDFVKRNDTQPRTAADVPQ